MVKLHCLGGFHEVGRNAVLISSKNTNIMMDYGFAVEKAEAPIQDIKEPKGGFPVDRGDPLSAEAGDMKVKYIIVDGSHGRECRYQLWVQGVVSIRPLGGNYSTSYLMNDNFEVMFGDGSSVIVSKPKAALTFVDRNQDIRDLLNLK